jgi:phosphoglycolate phosphatase
MRRVDYRLVRIEPSDRERRMPAITNVLFDLDGTLTDPADGITRCHRHALESLRLPCPPREELLAFIGPPLREAFATLCSSSDRDLIERAVALYRERFAAVGMYENAVYSGVPEMLRALAHAPRRLYVATSKVEIYAEGILRHFALADHFVAIHGSEPDGRVDDKVLLVSELIERHGLDRDTTVMIGDRRHDVLAARRNGIRAIGVTWGYGSRAELIEAGVDHLCDSPAAVVALVMANAPPGSANPIAVTCRADGTDAAADA